MSGKESLTELSGGQRSLLALSLILSLLLYKPAPMYILDEVDAALDLSHTQNIGNMLKTHFSQSQFIVVSLKEGMFNNANVIYRTKFVDGVSTVTRTIGTGSSRSRALTDNNDEEDDDITFSGQTPDQQPQSRTQAGKGKCLSRIIAGANNITILLLVNKHIFSTSFTITEWSFTVFTLPYIAPILNIYLLLRRKQISLACVAYEDTLTTVFACYIVATYARSSQATAAPQPAPLCSPEPYHWLRIQLILNV